MMKKDAIRCIDPLVLVPMDQKLIELINKAATFNRKRCRGNQERRQFRDALIKMSLHTSRKIGMPRTRQSVRKACALLHDTKQALKSPEIIEQLKEIQYRMREEIGEALFLQVPLKGKHKYMQASPLFGRRVARAFPSARQDITEAGKCWALDRNMACVFHLMRVVEAGLRAVWKANYGGLPGNHWGEILFKLQRCAEQGDDGLGEVVGHLTNIKDLWRNTTMHVDRHFNSEEALKIFTAIP